MYNENEENLFGWDMRHRPPITILPTEEHGWDGSHGRLADINKDQLERYHLKGMNAHEYLELLKDNLAEIAWNRDKASQKSKEIKEYINSITY